MRPHWDDVWLGVAQVIARRSLCVRAQVGAVIVNDRYRVVSTGYNGPPRGFDHRDEPCSSWCERGRRTPMPDYSDCPSLHAEANALMAADRSSWQGGVLYVTGDVCSGCAKLIGNSGLSRIVVQRDDADRTYRGSDDSYAFLRSLGIGVEVLPSLDFKYTGIRRDIYHIAWKLLNDEFDPGDDTYKGVAKDIHNAALQVGWQLVHESE